MMQIIGIAGGIASGKSLVSKMLCDLGAQRLDADKAGHEVLTEPAAIAALRARWGDDILLPAIDRPQVETPTIDRRAVAKIVFADPPDGPRELAFLESISHPRITAKLQERIAGARGQKQPPPHEPPALVLDAALMFRAGWRMYCDWLLFVEASREVRLERAQRRGWSAEEFQRREAAQEPVEWKRRQADIIIRNEADPSFTFAQVRAFWKALGLPA
jgi:dephospho-CoA kinase